MTELNAQDDHRPQPGDEDHSESLFECTFCGRIGSVGRCCGRDTRRPLNDAALEEVSRG